jgi:phosphate transport system substrate-binding protein
VLLASEVKVLSAGDFCMKLVQTRRGRSGLNLVAMIGLASAGAGLVSGTLGGCDQKAPAPATTPASVTTPAQPSTTSGSEAKQTAAPTPAKLRGEVSIDGSSTVFPVTEAIAEDFQNLHQGAVKVSVGVSGTGGGFKKFIRSEIDIADASRPVLSSELKDLKAAGIEFVELPIAFDALTVVVHKDNKFVDHLTVAELKAMWEPAAEGKVKTWKQVRSTWPDEPLVLFGAGSDSGTFDYFTEAVTGKAKASRTDYTASENDNTLVQGVSGNKGALGYFGYAYYVRNQDKLRAVPVINAAGKATAPSETTVVDGSYNPLSRPVFIYVSKKSLEEKPQVRGFVEYVLTEGSRLVREVKYIPLPDAAYAAGLARLKAMQTGTAFAGHSETGLHIDELFKRPLVSEGKPKEEKPAETKPAEAKPAETKKPTGG